MTTFPVFDHVAINVQRDLDSAVQSYMRLGFRLTPRGYHTTGSANHLAIFGTDYIELLGIPPNPSVLRKELLEWPIGINGLVFNTENVDRTRALLAEAGVAASIVSSFSRPVTLSDGSQAEASFRTLTLDRTEVDYGRIYFCEHGTRHLVWRDEDRIHPNGAVAISSVILSASDPDVAAEVFRRMFGMDAVAPIEGGYAMAVGLGAIEILSHATADERFGPSDDCRDCYMKAIVLRTRSLARASAFVKPKGDRILAGPDLTFGLWLEFVA